MSDFHLGDINYDGAAMAQSISDSLPHSELADELATGEWIEKAWSFFSNGEVHHLMMR